MLDWSQKLLGIQKLDARSPVGRHFLIVVPYSYYLIDSFILMSIHKRSVSRIYSQSRGRGPRENFLGSQTPFFFAPAIKNPGGATDVKNGESSWEWLRSGGLKRETESLLLTAQDIPASGECWSHPVVEQVVKCWHKKNTSDGMIKFVSVCTGRCVL